MNKCILSALIPLFALLATVLPPASIRAESLDQANTPAWTGGAVNIVPANTVSQTFVPSLPVLTAVEVALKTGNPGRGGDQVTFKILNAGGQQLSTTTASINEGFDGYWKFSLPGGGINVPPGQPLTIRLQDTGKNVFWWKYKDGNTYPAGQAMFHGSPFSTNDFFFKTYGTNAVQSFSLTVTPDPVGITKGGSRQVTIGVVRQSGFTGPVTVSFPTLPQGVSANPATMAISGSTGTCTLAASSSAATGQYTATVKGVSNAIISQKNFQVKVSAPAAPQISGVSPKMQQKGGTITTSGANFDPNCANNMVKIGSASTTATACTATSLTAQVPQQAPFGATQVTVTVSGRTSNAVSFTTARQSGNFTEITGNIVGQRSSRTCSTGAVKVDICSPNCSGYVNGAYVAFFRKTAGNADIGGPVTFFKDNPRVGGLGGAGFSLCDAGIVLDGNATVYQPQLMAFKLVDLGTGAQSTPYPFNWVTPAGNASYSPRIFQSPDGTIILFMTPANIGPAQLTAGFVDRVNSFRVIGQIPIAQITGTISAAVTNDNKISFSFAGTSYSPIIIP